MEEQTSIFNKTYLDEKVDLDFLQNETLDVKCNSTIDSTSNEILDFIFEYLFFNLDKNFYAFKGGYLLSKIISLSSRKTMDIDFSIALKEYYSKVKILLTELGNILIEKEIISFLP